VTCAVCGAADGWHRMGCPIQSIPTLGMGTVPLPHDDDPTDDLTDCAVEGLGAVLQLREAAA
jgi:hypothetical protein